MKFEVSKHIPTGPVEVVTTHRGQRLVWDVQSLARTGDRQRPREVGKIFDETNEMFSRIPIERQDLIWEGYKKVREILDSLGYVGAPDDDSDEDSALIAIRLSKAVRLIYDNLPLEEIRYWRQHYGKIRVPANLRMEYDDGGDSAVKHQRDTTYLYPEYLDLVDLTLAIRPMLPIWGEYVRAAKEDTGTCLKEFYALRLIRHTWLVNCPAVVRLKEYIDGLIARELKISKKSKEEPLALMIMSGIPDTEFPWILLGMTLARRLVTSEVNTIDERSHLVTNLHQFISSKIKSNAIDKNFGSRKFGNRLTAKKIGNERGEENQPSLIELNRVKQPLSDGDLVIIQHYASKPELMLRHAAPDVPVELFQICYKASAILNRLRIEDHHVILTQYAISRALCPRAVRLLTKEQMRAAMSVAQAIYWARGYYSLAALTTATSMAIDYDNAVLSTESTDRILRSHLEKLSVYPQHQGKRMSSRNANAATRAIETFSESITGYSWSVNGPEELLPHLQTIGSSRRMNTPTDIQLSLANFFISLTSCQQ